MLIAAALAVLVAIGLTVARAWVGPTVFDRILATNTIGTLAVCLMAVYGFLTERPEFLDIAIVYALLNVLSTLAILKFFRFGSLGDPDEIDQSPSRPEARP